MRNDTLDFIFSNFEDELVRLDPYAVAELGRMLEQTLVTILSASGPQKDTFKIRASIVAIHRGSAIVSFLAEILPGLTNEIKTSPLGSLNNALDIVERLAAIILCVAVKIDLAKPERKDASIPSDTTMMEVVGNRLLEVQEVQRQVEALLQQAMKVGAEQVSLRFPGEPLVIVSEAVSADLTRIGKSAMSSAPLGSFDGHLSVGADSLTIMHSSRGMDQSVTLYNGRAEIDGVMVPVVVQWNSRRPLPRPENGNDYSETVHVRGGLSPLAYADNLSPGYQYHNEGNKPIPASFRVAAALMTVNIQYVEE